MGRTTQNLRLTRVCYRRRFRSILVVLALAFLFSTTIVPVDRNISLNWQQPTRDNETIGAPSPVTVKVVLLSDTHGHHRELIKQVPDGDLLIFAGDLTYFGQREQVVDFNDWLGTLKHQHKIVVAGNHDGTWRHRKNDTSNAVVSLADLPALLTNAHYLQDSGFTFRAGERADGHVVRVWGSPWQPQYPGFETYRRPGQTLGIGEQWGLVPNDTTILVSHTPPSGVMDGKGRRGCVDLSSRIKQLTSLRMVAFGHFHEYGMEVDPNGLIYVNCAITDGKYRVVHNARVVSMAV